MKAEVMEQIEAFLAGRIDREQLEAQAREQEVTDLDAEIEWVREAQTAVEAAGLREQLQATLPRPATARVRRLRPGRRLLAIAATVLILVAAGLWLILGNGPESERLYAEYEYVDPGLPVLMSQSDEYALYDALTFYSEGNYSVAIEKLRALPDTYAGNDTLNYYLGASLLYDGQPEAARAALERVRTDAGAAFAERAQWLRVLAALRDGNRVRAEPILDEIIANPDHAFRAPALRLQAEWTE